MPSIKARRWYAKKAARIAIGGVGSLSASVWSPRSNAPFVLRVLTYHCFGPSRRDPFCLDQPSFARQMQWLAEHRLAISLDHALDFVAGRRELKSNAVLVTIDDGDAGIASHAWPILKRYDIPAVAFIIAGEIDTPGRLTTHQLRRLAMEGLTVGSHTLSHPSMARITREQARKEAEQSRQILERMIDQPVTSFAYPYGTLADFDESTGGLLEEVGYNCAFTSQHGPIESGAPQFSLPRIKVEAGDPEWLFPLLCRGALDHWRLVDRAFWRVQRPYAEGAAA